MHAATAAEPRDPRLKKILADWQERQHWFQAIEYMVSGIHKVPKGAFNNYPVEFGVPTPEVNPPRDLEAPVSCKFLLDFVKGRHRRERHEQVFNLVHGSLDPAVAIDVFNGSTITIFTPREENPTDNVGVRHPDISITFGNVKNGQIIDQYFPFFFAHGRIYTAMEPILPGRLRNKPDPGFLYVHGTSVCENQPCLVLRTQTLGQSTPCFDEYWVDTEKESAIVRYLGYSDKTATHDLNIHYCKSHGHWLPESWRLANYLSAGPLAGYREVRVEQITVDPSITDDVFELEVKPGMLVQEVTSLPTKSPLEWPKNKISFYRVKENEQREYVPDPYHRPGDQYQNHRPSQLPWLWILSFFVVGSFGILLIRRRRSAMR